jgi:predicted AlkP superfamily phosphohydrolase/phosphomutase
MCEAIGPFYTQGLAEETDALRERSISDAEFILQCDDVTAERMRMLDYALDRFHDGLLFFYFSSVDLRCHMMWRHIEPGHPARDEALVPMFANSIRDAYVQMDGALARVRERIGRDTPIVVLSDHGFAPFTRKVNLNRWLLDQGYLVPHAAKVAEHGDAIAKYEAAVAGLAPEVAAEIPKPRTELAIGDEKLIDRSRTRAFAMGFNGVYLNLKGRERDGVVDPSERDALLAEIRGKLLTLTDPETGERVLRRVDRSDEIYHGDQIGNAPDLVLGYERGYGADDDTALGTLSLALNPRVIYPNKELWCGNHLMAPEVVPGVVLTNRKLEPEDPDLCDLAATLLSYFGVGVPAEMRGTSLF